jgi:hypothetical protein
MGIWRNGNGNVDTKHDIKEPGIFVNVLHIATTSFRYLVLGFTHIAVHRVTLPSYAYLVLPSLAMTRRSGHVILLARASLHFHHRSA